MEKVTYSYARQNLSGLLDSAVDDAHEIYITRKNGKKAVLLSAEEYNSLLETVYLFSSPNNAKRLISSIKDAENKIGEEIDIQDLMDS